MRYAEFRDAIRREPFQPFRLRLSTGWAFDVLHPEFALGTSTSVFVATPIADDEAPDQAIECDQLRVAAIEPINGNGRSQS